MSDDRNAPWHAVHKTRGLGELGALPPTAATLVDVVASVEVGAAVNVGAAKVAGAPKPESNRRDRSSERTLPKGTTNEKQSKKERL